jgi:hypothetical protein
VENRLLIPIFQIDPQNPLTPVIKHLVVRDVMVLVQDSSDFNLYLRSRNIDALVLGPTRIPDASMTMASLLPTRLSHSGDLALKR